MTYPRSVADRLSLAAFALALAGLGLSIAFIFGSDTDTGQVRWWLVFTPVFVAAAPLVLPLRQVRIGAMVVLGAWCVLGTFSIGMLLLPALAAMVAAVVRDEG